MGALKQYSIPWMGLADGSHHFDFEINDSFFEALSCSDIKGGRVNVGADMVKSATLLSFTFQMTGNVTVECDRCLEDLSIEIDYEGDLQVKFSDETDDYDGEIMWISPSEGEVNIAQHLYENIILSLPYQRVHGTDADGKLLCNEDMLKRFKIISSEEFESIESKTESLEGNPEAEKLKALKDKMK